MSTEEIKTFPHMYRGEVVKVDDLERKNGLVQIFVPGVYPDAAKTSGNLPWAEPAMPLYGECNKYSGTWARPAVGSHVWVFFEGGDHMKPVFFATIPGGGWLYSSGPGVFAHVTKSLAVIVDESALQNKELAEDTQQEKDAAASAAPTLPAAGINIPGCIVNFSASATGNTNVTVIINGMLNIVTTNGAFINGMPMI